MTQLESLILEARRGNIAAFGKIVERTQSMVFAVSYRVLGDHADALDATQETFLCAFTRLDDLRESEALGGWLRRIAISKAGNIARRRRFAFLQDVEIAEIPILDERESSWTHQQRESLAASLLRLSADDRRVCDRFYHGGWNIRRLAADAAISEAGMRKRLQRIRDHLRKDVEMSEQQNVGGISLPENIPTKIVDLLSNPKLIDLPENPVGAMAELLKKRYAEYRLIDLPEIVEVSKAREVLGNAALKLPTDLIHIVDPTRFLRFDMALPLLIASRNCGSPSRLIATGQVYRNQKPTALRDQSFHQLELLVLDERPKLDPWTFMGQTLHVLSDLLPERNAMIERADFPECELAWEIAVQVDEKPVVVLSWGTYSDDVVRWLGGDPQRHGAFGLGYGLERLAAIHFGFDDIRKLRSARIDSPIA